MRAATGSKSVKSCFTHPVSAVVDEVMCSRSCSGYRPRVVTTNIRIKSADEPFDRAVKENELERVV
jgi:hypothetical protein